MLDIESVETYRPKTRETQAAYETLLSVVQEKLGDYATDVIAGAADEVLGILKSDKLKASSLVLPHSCKQKVALKDSL